MRMLVADVVFNQLHPDVHAPRVGDGHILRPRRAAPPRRPQEALPLPLRKPNNRQARIRCKDRVHVSPTLYRSSDWSSDTRRNLSFIAILFVDAVQRMMRVTAEADLAKSNGAGAGDIRTETNVAARKF